jgi:hypothetical protein
VECVEGCPLPLIEWRRGGILDMLVCKKMSFWREEEKESERK